jgi:cytidylate kinase
MIITISGLPGSGKTSVAKLLAEKLKFSFYSMGDIVEKFAVDNKMELNDFNMLRDKDTHWDMIIDMYQKSLSMSQKDLVIDGLTSFYVIPNSTKVFLDVNPDVGAERIFKAKRKDEPYKSVSDALKAVKRRINNDNARYKKIYSIDCHDKSNFDLVIDTSDLKVEEVVNRILGLVTKKK